MQKELDSGEDSLPAMWWDIQGVVWMECIWSCGAEIFHQRGQSIEVSPYSDDLKISITTKDALAAVRKFWDELPETSMESEHPEYTKEGFVEALLELVIGDDLVCASWTHLLYMIYLSLQFLLVPQYY